MYLISLFKPKPKVAKRDILVWKVLARNDAMAWDEWRSPICKGKYTLSEIKYQELDRPRLFFPCIWETGAGLYSFRVQPKDSINVPEIANDWYGLPITTATLPAIIPAGSEYYQTRSLIVSSALVVFRDEDMVLALITSGQLEL